ncbi:MAG TPA: hypothetical protein VJO33_01990 [Gemmatimonadaceae bacterium]|nr:hypothetical protein [Gemmatimonadaceae bacterium]
MSFCDLQKDSRIRLLTATLLFPGSLAAQVASVPRSAQTAAAAALNAQLDLAHLRRLHCVSAAFANCTGGLQIVEGFELLPGTQRGDTVWLPVRFHLLGTVASSEASLMFFPDRTDTHADSGSVTMIRRGEHWTMAALRVASERLQTSVVAARQFFRFEADDRRTLDSAARAPRTPRQPPPNERGS